MPQRVIIGVLTTEQRTDRQRAVLETWASELPDNWNLYFLVARPGKPSEVSGRYLYLDTVEAYENLPTKTHLFMNHCSSQMEFDYLVKCDDDVFINTDCLEQVLKNNKPHYAGRGFQNDDVDRTWHFGKCSDPVVNETPYSGDFQGAYCEGGLYVVDHECASLVGNSQNANFFSSELYEDKAVGDFLRSCGKLPMLLPHRLFAYRTHEGGVHRKFFRRWNRLAAHPISAQEMRNIWAVMQWRSRMRRYFPALPWRRKRLAS